MAKMLTGAARIEQISASLWSTIDNQLAELDSGRIILAPRKLMTDNNTNPFGKNDLCDVRAAHFHDLGCRYHKLIYVNLTVEELKQKMYLRIHKKRTKDKTYDIWVCDDIPLNHLSIEDAGFRQCNSIFKELLLACKVGNILSNTMRFAVNFNLGWLFSANAKLDTNKIYKDFI